MNEKYQEILTQIRKYKLEGCQVLIAGLLIKMLIGIVYAWPLLQSYQSILLHYDQLPKFKQFLLFTQFPLMNLTMNIFEVIPKGDKFLNYWGPNQTIIILSSIISISFSMIAYFDRVNFMPQLYQSPVFHCFMLTCFVGPSFGSLYLIPFQTTWKYFIRHKSQLNSLFQIFMGIGSLVIILIFESNFNGKSPLKSYYDEKNELCGICFQINIRESCRMLSIVAFLIGMAAGILIQKPNGLIKSSYLKIDQLVEVMVDYDLLAYQHEQIFKPQQPAIEVLDKEVMTLGTAIQSKQFKIMLGVSLFSTTLSFLMFSQYQRVSKNFGVDYETSSFLYKFIIVGYGLVRAVFTYITENKSYKSTMTGMIILNIICILSTLFALLTQNRIIFVISCSGLIIILNGFFATFSTYIPKVFGNKQEDLNHQYQSIAQLIFSIILILLALSNILTSILAFFLFVPQLQTSIFAIGGISLGVQFYILKQLSI